MVTKLSVDSAVLDEENANTQQEGKSRTNSALEDGESSSKPDSLSTSRTSLDPRAGQDYEPGLEVKGHLSASRESLLSPASPASNGGIYSVRFLIFFVAIFTIYV
uniref:Uncharacterized protein n=1 Tax=Biomphalaria glabrata TaxID=6526 RepID=A0A2C9LH92_BIOGL